jgi:ADP-ribose pyrophosphatase
MHLFFAEGLEEGDQRPETDESIEVVRVPVSEVPERLDAIEDAKSLVGVLLYLRSRAL